MTPPPTVSIVIPNYNGEHLLPQMLPPLLKAIARERVVEVLVSDGASTDGSVSVVRAGFPGVEVIPSDERLGFAANCNRGAARASGDVVVFLNTDVAVEPGFLTPLLAPFAAGDVFAVGPRIERPTPDRRLPINESVHRTFYSFGLIYSMGLHDREDPAEPAAIPYTCGAAMAVRRAMFEALGGFDTLYDPCYWEDLDICYRAWKRGWRVLYQPASTVRHEHRGTISRFYAPQDVETMIERNRWLFAWKNLLDPLLVAGHVAFLPAKIAEAAWQRRWAALRGFRLACTQLGAALRARARERRVRGRRDREVLKIFRTSARSFGRLAVRTGAGAPATSSSGRR